MYYASAYPLWNQGSMVWKPVEVKGYIPGAYSLAERSWRQALSRKTGVSLDSSWGQPVR